MVNRKLQIILGGFLFVLMDVTREIPLRLMIHVPGIPALSQLGDDLGPMA